MKEYKGRRRKEEGEAKIPGLRYVFGQSVCAGLHDGGVVGNKSVT